MKKGDTLWGISRRFNTTVQSLKQKNGLKCTLCQGRFKKDYMIRCNSYN